MKDGRALDGLRSLSALASEDPLLRAIAGRPVAVGWATVELDRAAAELGAALGLPVARFVEAESMPTLGARCRMARNGLAPGIAVVLLEPSTEGRLAATLARHDEGPAAVWLAVADGPAAIASLGIVGVAVSVEVAGPLGMERLLLDLSGHGPHRLIVERPGTIHP